MAVDMHPSRRPMPPAKPPASSTTQGTIDKMKGSGASGQAGVEYGFRHELQVHGDSTTMAHHFNNFGGKIHPKSADKPIHSSATHNGEAHMEGKMKGKAMRPGDERGNDEPG